MVLINNIEFRIYDQDTINSIIDRIAYNFNTLSKYIYIDKKNDTIEYFKTSTNNIIVINLVDIIMESNNIEELVTNISKYNINNEVKTDLIIYWLIFKQFLEIEEIGLEYKNLVLLELENQIKTIENIKIDVYNIWNNKVTVKKNILELIDKNKKKVEEYKDFFSKLEEIVPVKNSKFELESMDLYYTCAIEDLNNLELFNIIHLNNQIPFASFNNFYKILKDFLPYKSWAYTFEDEIILKILKKKKINEGMIEFLNKEDTPDSEIDNIYGTVFISIEGEPGEQVIKIRTPIEESEHNINYKEQLKYISEVLFGENKSNYLKGEPTIIEDRIKGIFYIPNQQLDEYVFSDLVMNNFLIANLLYIDESDKVTKEKNNIYIHFKDELLGEIGANITEKYARKNDPYLRGKDILNDFKLGSYYIRVKISRSETRKSVDNFINIFCKIMGIYNEERNNIINFYKKYIPTFGERQVEQIEEPKKIMLKNIDPQLFITDYSTKCQNQPIIIDDSEVEEYKAEGKQVMRYPATENEGLIQRNYVCVDNKKNKFIYPGLLNNDLSNADIAPYLPCCYTTDHSKIAGSNYRQYFFDDPPKQIKTLSQQSLIQGKSFVGKISKSNRGIIRREDGKLPDNLNNYLNEIQPTEGYVFLRRGFFDTNCSFLNCILEALGLEIIQQLEDIDSTLAYLNNLREKLSDYASICKQTLYDYSIEEIKEKIINPQEYFNPEYFIPLLEYYFNCNIYVFKRTKNSNDANLIIPRHTHFYYKYQDTTKNKNILIYEHRGSKSDQKLYPRCELIIRWKENTRENIDSYFTRNSTISIKILDLFNKLNNGYIFPINKILQPTYIKNINKVEINENIILIEQGIDFIGKCRLINLKYKDIFFSIFTTPIPPLELSIIDNWIPHRIDIKNFKEIIEIMNIQITHQKINKEKNMIEGFIGKWKNILICIPVNDSLNNNLYQSNNFDKLDINNDFIYPINNNSELYIFNKNKKLSRYIISYLLWLFSKYINVNNLQEIIKNGETNNSSEIENLLINFQKENISIISNFKYKNVSRIFSMNSGIMFENKLVIKSEETLKRLLYILRIEIKETKKIINYWKRQTIEKYFIDVSDFDYNNNQIVLQGQESIKQWILEYNLKYELSDKNQIKIEQKEPYFFQNILISPDIFIAQNTNKLIKAYIIGKTWIKEGYNCGYNCGYKSDDNNGDGDDNFDNILSKEELVNMNFTLWIYKNKKDIQKYIYGFIDEYTNKINILGYKDNNDNDLYTVLLK